MEVRRLTLEHSGLTFEMERDKSLQAGVNIELPGWNLVRTGQLELLKWHLDHDAKINPLNRGVFGENMFLYALLLHKTEIAKYLLNNDMFNRRLIVGTYGPKPTAKKSIIPPKDLKLLEEYEGENCLHLAIANHDISMVRYILKVAKRLDPEGRDVLPKILQQKVTGRFFKGQEPDSVYLGQTPLHFAVCTRQPKAVELILEAADGINPNSAVNEDDIGISVGSLRVLNDKDMYLNTCFHLAVLYGEADLWDIMLNHLVTTLMKEHGGSQHETHKQRIFRASSWLRDHQNLAAMTPVQFCVYVNNVSLFEHIVISCRLTIWEWSDRAYNAYNLSEIDSYKDLDLDRVEGVDVLTLLLTEAHLEFMSLAFINNILDDKWVKYGRKGVYFLLLLQVVFCLAMAVCFRFIFPDLYNLDKAWGVAAIHGSSRIIVAVFVFSKALLEIVIEVLELYGLRKIYGFTFGFKVFVETPLGDRSRSLDFMKAIVKLFSCCTSCAETSLSNETSKEDFLRYMKRFGAEMTEKEFPSTTGFFQKLRFISNAIILVIIFVLLIGYGDEGHNSTTDAHVLSCLLVGAVLMEWVQIFMYLQNIHMISRFVASTVAMLLNDIIGFMGVLAVILLSFSCALSLVWDVPWLSVMFPVFELGIGNGDFFMDFKDENIDDELDEWKKYLTYFLFIGWILIMIMLMLNLLIAVMSETAINMLGETFEYRQRIMGASTILMVERRLITLRYYLDAFLYLFAREKFETHEEWEERREHGCCICPPEDPDHHEHPWTGFIFQRTGVPGIGLCNSIQFEEALADELSRNFTFNVLDPIKSPQEKDDVIVEDSSLEKVALMFEEELENCDDITRLEKRVRAIQERLMQRMRNQKNDSSSVNKETNAQAKIKGIKEKKFNNLTVRKHYNFN